MDAYVLAFATMRTPLCVHSVAYAVRALSSFLAHSTLTFAHILTSMMSLPTLAPAEQLEEGGIIGSRASLGCRTVL